LLSILRLPRVRKSIIPIQYAINVKNYAAEVINIQVETDVNKLLTYVCGSNIYKQGEDIKLKPDSEYPEWLWNIRLEPPKLSDLDPNTKQYWRYVRRQALIRNNQMIKYK
ncbi:39S ribosomal protein L54, mitochondrial, partial [Eufriesea mexicana]